ncbi:[Fe-Fe] hydrogenase large subunit C-terminal domain-containing protein [Bacillota bacterium LX-D]|nr:[Fe-Fe] hydrogenase large subunit C-terminal domain-containing protein [Bacillota bacterium LX-D]
MKKRVKIMQSMEHYRELQQKVLFEIAQMAWAGTLEDNIESLPHKLATENSPLEENLIDGYIRLGLGLSAQHQEGNLQEAAAKSLNDWESTTKIIETIPGACQYCHDKSCDKGCNQGPILCSTNNKEDDQCLACGSCIPSCKLNAIVQKGQFVPLIGALKQKEQPVFAIVAPAFVGQFGPKVSIGQLRSALKYLGFFQVVEVALFADILTIKEAFEYIHSVQKERDYLITSCCCPAWIKLIENRFPNLLKHVAPSVSPMIAGGRVLKKIHQNIKVVFIGPCIAKKAEAADHDLKGAIDYVLTFKELKTIFDAVGINPADFPAQENPQSSWGGRVYARTGGVAASMRRTLQRLEPEHKGTFESVSLDGIKACQDGLIKISTNEYIGSFIEGMACLGGCVGGPGRIIDTKKAAELVGEYGDKAEAQNPLENQKIAELLASINQKFTPDTLADWGILHRKQLR